MPGAFPDDVSLGILRLGTASGWQRWFDARGPVSLVGLAVALDAGPAALDHLSELPAELRGLSLAGLDVDDDELALVVHRLPLLVWLDLRGTAVTTAGLALVHRLRRLRHLGVDEALLTEETRTGRAWFGPGVATVTEGGELVPTDSGVAALDVAGFNALLAAAVATHPGMAATDPAAAIGRASVLQDAGRPEQALAVLAPLIPGADPGLLLVAAKCVNDIGTSAQALAALALAPPTIDILAWRAVYLSRMAPAQSVLAADAALRESPQDSAALWATCTAYLNAGQNLLAERALAELEQQRPEWPDTAKLAARLARAQRRFGDEITAWHRVLADQPDNADALAGLARAQRSAHPLSLAWMSTLNSAATADVDRHGPSLLEQVTLHRRRLARVVGVVTALVAFVLGVVPWLEQQRIGWVLVIGLVAANLTAGLLWLLTPAAVRQVIRRTDDLTGLRRGPDWRRGLVAVGIGAVVLAVPLDLPKSDMCGGRYQTSCPEPIVVPTINVPRPTFSFGPIPTFSMPPMPTFPTELDDLLSDLASPASSS